MAPTPRLVSVDEYLNSSYHPDLEFVDGLLVRRGRPMIAHGLLQGILIGYFLGFRKEFRYAVLVEVRTQIVQRARYRIPAVMLCPVPLPAGTGAVPFDTTAIFQQLTDERN